MPAYPNESTPEILWTLTARRWKLTSYGTAQYPFQVSLARVLLRFPFRMCSGLISLDFQLRCESLGTSICSYLLIAQTHWGTQATSTFTLMLPFGLVKSSASSLSDSGQRFTYSTQSWHKLLYSPAQKAQLPISCSQRLFLS